MIELTGCDPSSYRIETWREYILLDNLLHFSEYFGRSTLAHTELHFSGGKMLGETKFRAVTESVDEVSKRIRKYAETDQEERMRAWIAEEVARAFGRC